MSEQSDNQNLENESSLGEIIVFLSKSWKIIALSGVVGGLLAVWYVFNIPPKYMATASIQVAKVAGSDIEPIGMLAEKIKMPMFYSAASYSACNVANTGEPGEIISKNLKLIPLKNTSMITISYKDNSLEGARKCLESIFKDVRNDQTILAEPILLNKKNQLAHLKKTLEEVEKFLKTLPSVNSSSDNSISTDVFWFAASLTRLSKEAQINELREKVIELENSLREPQTKNTFLIAPIYSPKQKVSPQRESILMGGVVAGVFLGLLFMIIKLVRFTYKDPN